MKRSQGGRQSRPHPTRILGMLTALLLVAGSDGTPALGQQHAVSGTVVDADTDTVLPGTNVIVKGTQIGTTTDTDGRYMIDAPSPQDTLVFSFVGYETQEIPIDGRSVIDVLMAAETVLGEELVVVGYGVQRRRDVTGAVSSVDPEQLTDIPTQSLEDALQGKVAGVQVTPTSGRPGDQPVVRIRGVGTLNNADPLYVVDGMLLDDISFLDPRNVESVDVLKDASATAIYGSRGANGVVLITTKTGVPGQRTQVSANSYYGAQRVNDRVDMLNAREFAILTNEAAVNEGKAPVFEDPDAFGEGFDWQDWVLNDPSPLHSHQISASGGTENFRFNVSGNLYSQRGVVRKSDYERITLRVNNQYFVSDAIDFGHNINFAYEEFQQESRGRGVVGLLNHSLQAPPTLDPMNEEGEFTDVSMHGGRINPAASVAFNNNENNTFRTTGNLFLNLDLLEGLRFRTTFGLDWTRNDSRDFVPEFFVTPIQNTTESRLTVFRGGSTNWLNENTLTYRRAFGDHSFDVVGGITMQEFTAEHLGASRLNIPASALTPQRELLYLNAGETEGQTNFNAANSWGMMSFLSRANYGYKGRYLLTGTFRRDGSSRFARRHRWGNFPSVAAGWVISNESFMDNVPIDYLKIRGSWGRIGNDKIATDAAIPTVRSNLNAVFGENQDIHSGAAITDLANPDLRWEETAQLDVGLELSLFDSRLNATIDYYDRETSDILVRVPIPNVVGVPTEPFVNAASVLNRGLEFDVSWGADAGDFTYDIGFNATTVHNEVLSLGGGRDEIRAAGVRNIGQTTITIPGEPIGSFFGWRQAGIFQTQEEIDNSPNIGEEQPGDIKIADLNGDGLIDGDDRTILGSPIPDVYYGANLAVAYKGIDLSMVIDGQAGNKILYARTAERGFGLFNYEDVFLDRWTGAGTSSTEPRLTEGGHNYSVLDRFLYDGDFLRLRNVQVGYSLPAGLANKLNVSRLRVYLNATNMFTFTDYIGYNPQIGGGSVIATGIDNGTYPIASSYTLGAQLDF